MPAHQPLNLKHPAALWLAASLSPFLSLTCEMSLVELPSKVVLPECRYDAKLLRHRAIYVAAGDVHVGCDAIHSAITTLAPTCGQHHAGESMNGCYSCLQYILILDSLTVHVDVDAERTQMRDYFNLIC